MISRERGGGEKKKRGRKRERGPGGSLVDRESGKKTLLPSASLSLSLASLTRKKGPYTGWTELGRACRRGAGQGQGHITWVSRRAGHRAEGTWVEGGGAEKPGAYLGQGQSYNDLIWKIRRDRTKSRAVQIKTARGRVFCASGQSGPLTAKRQSSGEGVTGARVQRRN